MACPVLVPLGVSRSPIPDLVTMPEAPREEGAVRPSARRIGLFVVQSPDLGAQGRFLEIEDRALVLGRSAPRHVQIADSMLSRRHLRVRKSKHGAELMVDDLGSRNGTFVGGERIDGATSVRPGAVIRAGGTVMVVDREPDHDSLPAGRRADPGLASEIVGDSLATQRLRRSVATVAPTPDPVLILGETGTGKEVTARAIHRLSGRSGPFVAVNCAAIPADLAEAELFGARKGAFTGAQADRLGFFGEASGGTLFLDEVGELPAMLQAKLLRTLEDGVIQPLGGGPPEKLDLRVVAATNADLETDGFRSDLLARLADWVLNLPPLIERRADVVALWEHFAGEEAASTPRTPAFTETLLLYDWPLNARGLRKVAKRLMTLVESPDRWCLEDLPSSLRRRSSVTQPALRQVPDRAALEAALDAAEGNVSKVAQALNYDRKQIYRFMNRLGLTPDQFRRTSGETP